MYTFQNCWGCGFGNRHLVCLVQKLGQLIAYLWQNYIKKQDRWWMLYLVPSIVMVKMPKIFMLCSITPTIMEELLNMGLIMEFMFVPFCLLSKYRVINQP